VPDLAPLSIVEPHSIATTREATLHRGRPMLAGLEMLIPATVTHVVFVFLCSKPAFVCTALIAGLVAHHRGAGSAAEQLPNRH